MTRILFPLLMLATLNCWGQDNLEIARDYLRSNKDEWSLSSKDIAQMEVSSDYFSEHSGVNHIYFQQILGELEVTTALFGIHIDASGKVVHATSSFISNIQNKISASDPLISPDQALFSAAEVLELPIRGALKKRSVEGNRTTFEKNVISNRDIPVELCYYPDSKSGKVYLAWKLDIDEIDKPDFWNLYIDATTGELIAKKNYTLHCNFDSSNHSEHTDDCSDHESEIGVTSFFNLVTPNNDENARFNVFPLPVESPIHGERSIILNPADPIASPYGWQDTNGIPGVDLTISRGNNVHSFLDIAAQNRSQGDEPDAGEALNFDFPFDPEGEPDGNKEAAVTQLYYVNNIMHDIFYHYGFDEASGNFQFNNYGNGGEGDDYVLAQAQDGGDFNNANFATLPDGIEGRMQMYLWDVSGIGFLEVLEPEGIAERVASREANFGPRLTQDPIEGELVLASDGSANPSLLCRSAVNTSELNGKIALIDRGSCFFEEKVRNAQEGGAIAAIICNTRRNDLYHG